MRKRVETASNPGKRRNKECLQKKSDIVAMPNENFALQMRFSKHFEPIRKRGLL
jgi:hypothetical protein